MLLAASQLAARSVYVGGNTSSTTGLTVTLTKEERGESAIEGQDCVEPSGDVRMRHYDDATKEDYSRLLLCHYSFLNALPIIISWGARVGRPGYEGVSTRNPSVLVEVRQLLYLHAFTLLMLRRCLLYR